MDQRDPVEGDGLGLGGVFGRNLCRCFDQITDDHLVALSISVLKIGQGIDPAHIGQQPRFLGQPADGPQRRGGKDLAVLWLQHKDQVVILGKLRLELIEGDAIGVFLGEENPRIGIERDVLQSGPERHDQNQ